MKRHSPSLRSKANATRFVNLTAQGLSFHDACREIGCAVSFMQNWLNQSPTLKAEYARAKDELVERYAEEIVGISDNATVRDAHVARLRVDSRKWVAAKLLPKKYGDRPNEINVNTQINLAIITPEDQARLQARRLELLGGS